jgi:hypothetical protein
MMKKLLESLTRFFIRSLNCTTKTFETYCVYVKLLDG